MNFNILIYIVIAIVPVCMFIRVACDIRDAVSVKHPIHPPEFTQQVESLKQQHPDDSNFASIIDSFKNFEYDHAYANAHPNEDVVTEYGYSVSVESLLTSHVPAPIPALVTFPSHSNASESVTTVMSQPIALKPRPPVIEVLDLSKLTIRELKAIAKERKLKNYGKMVKSELINALS